MKNILVITGSTRENNKAIKVAKWLLSKVNNNDVNYTLADLREIDLPHYSEPGSPRSSKEYVHDKTKQWSKIVDESDGIIFITPEYNGYFTGALKDAIDYLHSEWVEKPYGIVGYGSRGAQRAVTQLHNLLTSFDMKPIKRGIGINQVWEAFENNILNEEFVDGDILEFLTEIENEAL